MAENAAARRPINEHWSFRADYIKVLEDSSITFTFDVGFGITTQQVVCLDGINFRGTTLERHKLRRLCRQWLEVSAKHAEDWPLAMLVRWNPQARSSGDRWLATVWLGDDELSLNEAAIASGIAEKERDFVFWDREGAGV